MLTNETLLLRQIHPNFLVGEEIKTPSFNPSTYGDKAISVYNGDIMTPSQAYENYTKLKLQSAGVFAVTVKECKSLGLIVEEDPTEENPAHVLIKFSPGHGDRDKEALRNELVRLANERGALFLPRKPG